MKTVFWVLLILLLAGLWQREWLGYAYMQLSGGAGVILRARPVSEVMAAADVPDSVRQQLRLIEAMRRFGIDSLGLRDTRNYTTYYDQHGRPLCYVLTVAQRYRLRVVPFHFPVIGDFNYKGFFDQNRGRAEQQRWQQQGYDTELAPVAAYSTLGYFPDPILSGMLSLPEGRLADLLFHEMTHATVFRKNQHEWNENLASFVGQQGAAAWLAHRYGAGSAAVGAFEQNQLLRQRRVRYYVQAAARLDSLYGTFSPAWAVARKDSLKHAFIARLMAGAETLMPGRTPLQKPLRHVQDLPNNAFFVGFLTYNARSDEFARVFREDYKSDLRAFLKGFVQRYQHP